MIERAGEYAFDHPLHVGNGSIRMQWHFLDTSRLPDPLLLLVVWGEPGTTDWSGFGSAQAARSARQARQSR